MRPIDRVEVNAFVAIVLSLLHSLAITAIAYVLVFWALFPWENHDDPGSDDWLIAVAVILFASSAATFVTLVAKRRRLARIALAVHLAVALAIAVGALKSSRHSDLELVGLVFGVETIGVVAFAIRFRSAAIAPGQL